MKTSEPIGLRTAQIAQVEELLVRQLLASPWYQCGGFDGATVSDVLAAEYPVAVANGLVPGQLELAGRYPDLASTIDEFFALR